MTKRTKSIVSTLAAIACVFTVPVGANAYQRLEPGRQAYPAAARFNKPIPSPVRLAGKELPTVDPAIRGGAPQFERFVPGFTRATPPQANRKQATGPFETPDAPARDPQLGGPFDEPGEFAPLRIPGGDPGRLIGSRIPAAFPEFSFEEGVRKIPAAPSADPGPRERV